MDSNTICCKLEDSSTDHVPIKISIKSMSVSRVKPCKILKRSMKNYKIIVVQRQFSPTKHQPNTNSNTIPIYQNTKIPVVSKITSHQVTQRIYTYEILIKYTHTLIFWIIQNPRLAKLGA